MTREELFSELLASHYALPGGLAGWQVEDGGWFLEDDTISLSVSECYQGMVRVWSWLATVYDGHGGDFATIGQGVEDYPRAAMRAAMKAAGRAR